jgi:N-acyl homoserine lactone hydrolase
MACNPLWGERQPVRTGHATTTLVITGKRRILVDPGLPAPALLARLGERVNLRPGDITDIFLTSFHPDARRAIEAFPNAAWWISETERETVGIALAQQLKRAVEAGDDPETIEVLRREVAILQRCRPPGDIMDERVSLFPLPGVSPGLCGLLLEGERHTTVICGDAVPTGEHVELGRVPSPVADVDKARASFEEAIEVADLLIPGRDNVFVNPTKRAF